jgi:hypothetical protein
MSLAVTVLASDVACAPELRVISYAYLGRAMPGLPCPQPGQLRHAHCAS